MSFAHDLLGCPTEVVASATFTRTGVDASVATLLTHEGGAVSTSFSSPRLAVPNRASVQGSDGRVEIAGNPVHPTSVTLHDVAGAGVEEARPEVTGRGMLCTRPLSWSGWWPRHSGSDVMSPEGSVEVMRTLDVARERIGLRGPGE